MKNYLTGPGFDNFYEILDMRKDTYSIIICENYQENYKGWCKRFAGIMHNSHSTAEAMVESKVNHPHIFTNRTYKLVLKIV